MTSLAAILLAAIPWALIPGSEPDPGPPIPFAASHASAAVPGPGAAGPAGDGSLAGSDWRSPQEHELPPSAEDAAERLRTSPRHGEWTMIPAGTRDSVRAWVVYPERSEAAPVVVVIHEIFGLTTWVRAVADQLAAQGFIAVAPDLLTGKGVEGNRAGDPEREAAVSAIRSLDPDEVHRRLRAASRWGTDLPAATDRYGVVGFCWGGSTSFAHATRDPELDAAAVFYGSSPEAGALEDVQAPVLGLYGGDDERVNATIPRADSVLSALGRTYEVNVYDGAGHGFLRQQEGRDGANRAATEQAWPTTVEWFRTHLER